MAKITYEDKLSPEPLPNEPSNWVSANANEVKAVVNDNITVKTTTVTVKLDEPAGYWVNTSTSPITATEIPVDLTNAIDGGSAFVWYNGNVLDASKITGVTVALFSGENILNELCLVGIVYNLAEDKVIINILPSTP